MDRGFFYLDILFVDDTDGIFERGGGGGGGGGGGRRVGKGGGGGESEAICMADSGGVMGCLVFLSVYCNLSSSF